MQETHYNFNNGKVFGLGLSFNGISVNVENEAEFLRLLEYSFEAGQKFKSKQVKKILKNELIDEPEFVVEDCEDCYRIKGPKYGHDNWWLSEKGSDYKKLEVIADLLQKAFKSGKEERAREIKMVLEQ